MPEIKPNHLVAALLDAVPAPSAACTGLKPHPGGRPVKCVNPETCKVSGCIWKQWHKL